MKTPTLPDSTFDMPASGMSRGRAVLDFAHGAVLLAGIIILGAAALLIGLVSWPFRLAHRRLKRRPVAR